MKRLIDGIPILFRQQNGIASFPCYNNRLVTFGCFIYQSIEPELVYLSAVKNVSMLICLIKP